MGRRPLRTATVKRTHRCSHSLSLNLEKHVRDTLIHDCLHWKKNSFVIPTIYRPYIRRALPRLQGFAQLFPYFCIFGPRGRKDPMKSPLFNVIRLDIILGYIWFYRKWGHSPILISSVIWKQRIISEWTLSTEYLQIWEKRLNLFIHFTLRE